MNSFKSYNEALKDYKATINEYVSTNSLSVSEIKKKTEEIVEDLNNKSEEQGENFISENVDIKSFVDVINYQLYIMIISVVIINFNNRISCGRGQISMLQVIN